jgi:chromosome segregation ATPase
MPEDVRNPSAPDPAWWSLHLRKARGETLTDEERAAYAAGLRPIEEAETFPGAVEELRRLRSEVTRLEAECADLEARRDTLDEQIAALEARLTPGARRLLGVEG